MITVGGAAPRGAFAAGGAIVTTGAVVGQPGFVVSYANDHVLMWSLAGTTTYGRVAPGLGKRRNGASAASSSAGEMEVRF